MVSTLNFVLFLTILMVHPNSLYITASGDKCAPITCVWNVPHVSTLAYIPRTFQERHITGGDIKEVNQYCIIFEEKKTQMAALALYLSHGHAQM
jgi:hypothetical protein